LKIVLAYMGEEQRFSFEGRSRDKIEGDIRLARDTAEMDALNRRGASGMKRMAGKLKDLLQSRAQRSGNVSRIRQELESTGSELTRLIEKYAGMALSAELKLRFQREEYERIQLEDERHELHNQIRSLATNIGIPETKILELIEMRVQDRLSESEIRNISREATDAAGIPLQAHDDNLVYVQSYSNFYKYEWRLPNPEEQKNTYSLVYSCIVRPHDEAYYELAQDTTSPLDSDHIVPKDRIDYVINLLKKTAEDLKSKDVLYSQTQSHYCHDDENYPRDDWMAFRYVTFFIRCPKKEIRRVIQRLEMNSKGEQRITY